MKATAIILAAGQSTRMGVPKALLELAPSTSFLAHLVAQLDRAGLSALVVVGAHAGEIRAAHPDLLTVLNPDWPSGQLSSVKVGLRAALAQGVERILVHPVDAPLIAPATARAVLEALALEAAIVPTLQQQPGHPLGLRASAARALLSSPATTLAEAVGLLTAALLPVEDPAILDNFNSPEAYRARFGHPPRPAS